MLTTILGLAFVALAAEQVPADTGQFTSSGIWYRVSGNGPAVLVHGSNLDSRSLGSVATALVPTHRVIETDLRFHGRSRDGSGPFSFDRDMIEVLDAAHVPSATVVGHSLGAAVALDMALAAPSRVERLVLLAPTIGGKAATRAPEGFDAVIRALQSNDMQQVGVAIGATPVMTLRRDTTGQETVRRMVAENVRLFRADRTRVTPTGPPAIGRLLEIAVPMLVLTGSADPTEAGEAARELLAQVVGARGETLAGCGHLLPMDCGPEVVRVVRGFLLR